MQHPVNTGDFAFNIEDKMTVKYVFEARVRPGEMPDAIRSFDIYLQTPGFVSMELLQDPDFDDRLFCCEVWESEEAHKMFVGSLSQKAQAQWLKRFVGAPVLHGRFKLTREFGIREQRD